MKKIGMLFVCTLLAAACGGSNGGGAKAPTHTATAPARTEAPTYASKTPAPAPEPAPMPEQAPGQPTTPAAPVAPAPAPAPAASVATAELKSVKDGSSMGTVTFQRDEGGTITITGDFTGLKAKSVHAFYIHENGDCSNKAKKVGKHLNPTHVKHGPPASSTRHAGDFGNLTADETGHASFSMQTDSVTMEGDRPDSIVNRSIVIHASKDDKRGSGGAPLACGVITVSQQ